MSQSKKKDSAPPTVQYFAAVLRLLRERAGLTQEELGALMNYTGSAVSAVETCAKPPTDEFIDAAEKALDAGGLLRSAIKYLRLERYPVYFQGFVHFEQEELEQLVEARMDRKALFHRKPMALIHTVLEESALRRQIGDREVMHAQYEHLVQCAGLPNVTIQVMPLQRAEHAGLRGPMKLIETPDESPLVYMESHDESILVSKADKVGALTRRYAMIRTQALGPDESVSFIKQLMGET
ncbi:helix-turn-helix transcriptional regulator [Streptomyces sp. NPDC005322]|uniref:helix-turn-helix domain-containing protein n=1 Tax=Streptomyces sp. NPDC005322 TaxID=3157032 RepID=UPI0033B72E41